MTTATETKVGILEQVAQALGEGWAARPYSRGDGDGYMLGPGGEVFHVDLRAFGQWGNTGSKYTMSLKRLVGAGGVERIDSKREDGETLADVVAKIAALYPHWRQAHTDDQAKCAEIMEPCRKFAEEVASNMGDGWEGGCEHDGRGHYSNESLSPVAFVAKGELRVEWHPLNTHHRDYNKDFYAPVERLSIQGYRDRWPNRLYSTNPTITVAATHTAKRVAGEITRRLLPGYVETMTKAAAEDGRHLTAVEGAALTAARVRKALGGMGVSDGRDANDDSETVNVSFWTEVSRGEPLQGLTVHGDVKCYAGGASLELKASMLDERAIKILLQAITDATNKLRD